MEEFKDGRDMYAYAMDGPPGPPDIFSPRYALAGHHAVDIYPDQDGATLSLLNHDLDALLHMLQFLTPVDISKLAVTAWKWKHITDNDSLWTFLYRSTFEPMSLFFAERTTPEIRGHLLQYKRKHEFKSMLHQRRKRIAAEKMQLHLTRRRATAARHRSLVKPFLEAFHGDGFTLVCGFMPFAFILTLARNLDGIIHVSWLTAVSPLIVFIGWWTLSLAMAIFYNGCGIGTPTSDLTMFYNLHNVNSGVAFQLVDLIMCNSAHVWKRVIGLVHALSIPVLLLIQSVLLALSYDHHWSVPLWKTLLPLCLATLGFALIPVSPLGVMKPSARLPYCIIMALLVIPITTSVMISVVNSEYHLHLHPLRIWLPVLLGQGIFALVVVALVIAKSRQWGFDEYGVYLLLWGLWAFPLFLFELLFFLTVHETLSLTYMQIFAPLTAQFGGFALLAMCLVFKILT